MAAESGESSLDPPPAIFLMGPTATGKTDVAASLSAHFDVELISVDAAQVYRGMNIGTAKPGQGFLERYPHHLVDIRNPDQGFSAADFVSEAGRLIEEIRTRRRIPLLVGGTMFYFNALERGLSALPSASPALRIALEQEIAERGITALHEELESVDPDIARRIDPADRQRVQRALEIFRVSGRTPSSLMTARRRPGMVPLKLTLFDSDRGRLHDRIARRFVRMVGEGLVEEVESLVAAYPAFASLSSGRIVGYRQVLGYLGGQYNEITMIDAGTAATRQLAKRQLTWLRQQSGVVWFDRTGDSGRSSQGTTVARIVATYLAAHPRFAD